MYDLIKYITKPIKMIHSNFMPMKINNCCLLVDISLKNTGHDST